MMWLEDIENASIVIIVWEEVHNIEIKMRMKTWVKSDKSTIVLFDRQFVI